MVKCTVPWLYFMQMTAARLSWNVLLETTMDKQHLLTTTQCNLTVWMELVLHPLLSLLCFGGSSFVFTSSVLPGVLIPHNDSSSLSWTHAVGLLSWGHLDVQRNPWLLVPHITVLILLGSRCLQEGGHELLGNSQQESPGIHNGLAAFRTPTSGLVIMANLTETLVQRKSRASSANMILVLLLSPTSSEVLILCIFQEAGPLYDTSAHVMLLGLCDYWNNSFSLGLVTSPVLRKQNYACLL